MLIIGCNFHPEDFTRKVSNTFDYDSFPSVTDDLFSQPQRSRVKTVSFKTVQVGVLGTPCISRVLCLTAIHLFPKMGKYGEEMFPCIVIVNLEV